MANYRGKIRIEGNGTAVSISVQAANPSEAKRIASSQCQIK
jgi:hypothetical protein